MKIIGTLFLLSTAMGLSAQVKTNDTQTSSRNAASSVQAKQSPLPYDVEDKYMGRKAEFLNNMVVSELPADFPPYDKKWSVQEYNVIVDTYYSKHTAILKESVRKKIQYLYPGSN